MMTSLEPVIVLACTISVPLPPDAPSDALPLQMIGMPLSADQYRALSGTIPVSSVKFVGEAENQRQFLVPITIDPEIGQELMRLSSDTPSYSPFSPFKARIGSVAIGTGEAAVFSERTQGTCRFAPYENAEKGSE